MTLCGVDGVAYIAFKRALGVRLESEARVLRNGPEAHGAIDGEADLSGLEHHGLAAPGTSRRDRRPRRSCPDAPASSIGERRDAVDTGYVSGADGQRHPDQSTLEVGGEELDVPVPDKGTRKQQPHQSFGRAAFRPCTKEPLERANVHWPYNHALSRLGRRGRGLKNHPRH